MRKVAAVLFLFVAVFGAYDLMAEGIEKGSTVTTLSARLSAEELRAIDEWGDPPLAGTDLQRAAAGCPAGCDHDVDCRCYPWLLRGRPEWHTDLFASARGVAGPRQYRT